MNNLPTNNGNNNRRTNLQILEDRRSDLAKSLLTHKNIVDTISKDKQEPFKKNFIELATQDYLLSIVSDKELIRFTAIVTEIGLNISPSANECYIIPFDTKVNNQKVMLPQVVIPLNGNQQLAFDKNFMLTVEAVYVFDDGSEGSESELTRKQQAQLQTANPEWVEKHFIGFDVILVDLLKELPTQKKFVDLNYVKEATKTIKDNRWRIQSWTHKAVRRAYKQFAIPKNRQITVFNEVENLNDSMLNSADSSSNKLLTTENENALIQMGVKLQKFNGVAIASNFNGKEKILTDFGFTKNGGNWSIEYEEILPQVNAVVPPQNAMKNPAKVLFSHLSKKLDNNQIKDFVNDVLGLTKDDTQGISEVLEDLDLLNKMVEDYLNPIPEIDIDDVSETENNTLF